LKLVREGANPVTELFAFTFLLRRAAQGHVDAVNLGKVPVGFPPGAKDALCTRFSAY
jgi:hypothetical protein